MNLKLVLSILYSCILIYPLVSSVFYDAYPMLRRGVNLALIVFVAGVIFLLTLSFDERGVSALVISLGIMLLVIFLFSLSSPHLAILCVLLLTMALVCYFLGNLELSQHFASMFLSVFVVFSLGKFSQREENTY